jgi:hypothetical protein
MNAPPDDENLFANASFNRAARRGAWVIWAGTIIYFGGVLFLPRPLKAVVGLGGMAFLCLGVLGFVCWLAPRSPLMNLMRPAGRHYVTRFLPAMLLCIAVFEAATWYYMRMHPTGFMAVLAALAPSVPILFVIRATVRLLKEETDEYLRTRALETSALATGLALSVCTVWGFLDLFEVVPHMPLLAALPLWACCIGPARWILNRRT